MKVFYASFFAIWYSISTANGEIRLGSPKKLAPNQQRALQEQGTLTYLGTNPVSAGGLGLCEGDCDGDQDCQGDMICFQRINGDSTPIPGCVGTFRGGADYCYYAGMGDLSNTEPDLFVRDEATLPISDTPLAECEGDCNHDGECAGSLQCFQRGGTEAVPGCRGTGFPAVDFCHVGLTLGGPPPITPGPTKLATTSPTMTPGGDVTPAPSVAPGYYPVPVSNPGNNLAYALGNCQADCDSDVDCEGPLRCFQRSRDTTYVPGCLGTPEGNWDYCYFDGNAGDVMNTPQPSPSVIITLPPLPKLTTQPSMRPTDPPTSQPTPTISPSAQYQLVIVGDNKDTAAFPLKLCQGDCDNDDDCEGELECWHRNNGEDHAPNSPCVGTPFAAKDYCYDPRTTPPTLSPTEFSTFAPTSQTNPDELLSELKLVGDGNDNVFPLGHCEGDCDNDNDCEGAMVCFQRDTGDLGPPGCFGTPYKARDYCYYDGPTPATGPPAPTTSPTPSPTESPTDPPTSQNGFDSTVSVLSLPGNDGQPSSAFPLGHCEGDCDNDNDCQGSMVCFQRNRNDEGPPGCTGTPEDGRDYCYYEDQFDGFATLAPTGPPVPTTSPTPTPTRFPTPSPTSRAPTPGPTPGVDELVSVGNNNFPAGTLAHCRGDCDTDNDCANGLECFQRQSHFQPVPGCNGQGVFGEDYCYRRSDAPQGIFEPNKFKLKLFWKDGYMWQESPKEQRWCILCKGEKCRSGVENELLVDYCHKSKMEFEFVYPEGKGAQIKMIGKDLCLQRTNVRALRAATCNATSPRQRWSAGRGDFYSDQFELQPVNRKNGCVSQHHHPKPDELLYVETCAKAHRAETGYWSRWYG